mmetsp:Transcript_15948/g.23458  ORF Transcript_15948/g.23458 Transcript_15948/m.23458 type:complete len:1647 (+) Transcript_15948:145-5085(+)|eukprot:CAMPEP_0194213322 /NCGR_PEP_ID=MMETSP0156-20130528/13776_1 /TAXON_ID=33649 /ORGANISM="Thalassionema nitzschioides, Strain L26-B" /LENGTH=1646 /DNA_ID=CAMNT_0038941315 /DNA_START=95 /DNA_END=5035 /DNA_ORIENTATION=+
MFPQTNHAPDETARHICEEARVVLCSLRCGPPSVARGELAHDLQDLRVHVRAHYLETSLSCSIELGTQKQEEEETNNSRGSPTSFVEAPQPPAQKRGTLCSPNSRLGSDPALASVISSESVSLHDVGPFARPFLAVVVDPRAAGPHTLVALRALFRLLSNNSFVGFPIKLEALMKGVLQCKFEQTDAGADEAVEMAIADLLALLVTLDSHAPDTIMDAFNTVFVTRNTFVHSPALCYHFEVVLGTLVDSVFKRKDSSAKLILEFLVNQLLHTPLSSGPALDEAAREAQIAHDATRVLCLKLSRRCLMAGWDDEITEPDSEILSTIQDDLCLSLLMTGQAIWAYPSGHVSLDVLSEICATISTLWNITALRPLLIPQFESIFTGFYQRALMLLRKRPNPVDSTSFNENLIFDAELELILESLVDLLFLQEQKQHESPSTLESLFTTYDCDLGRSDVAEHLVVELARCCGAVVSDEGVATLEAFEIVDNQRPVPPHLKELCAECLLSCLKTLFHTSEPAQADGALSSVANIIVCVEQTSSELVTNDLKGTAATSELGSNIPHSKVKSRKRQFRKGAKLFNEKPSKGIYFLVKSGYMEETPLDVATFLRNGLVLGLDKAIVGQYLGELGKAPSAGKSPPCWERDWFHKEVLNEYCGLFDFEKQSLLEGLRMFLASFRLPGEGQMIDRIVQSFADSCGRRCDESVKMKLFSDDPKRASDTAFLLAYSIIMLNTDQHNPHVKEDKKMSRDAFIRNNADYGRDITEKGKELPPDFLEMIYDSIREEEIRTEGEGAEGHMTVERWKDVLRGSTASLSIGVPESKSEDLKQLVVETLWMPVASTVGAFWGIIRPNQQMMMDVPNVNQSGVLCAQGARLGMDLALELMAGVRTIGRIDIFRLIFSSVCGYSGLLGGYKNDAVERTTNFVKSVEAQSAVIVAIRTAHEAANDLGIRGWMDVWTMILELRDLKLLSGGLSDKTRSLLRESDSDFLTPASRREWILKMVKGGFDDESSRQETSNSFFGAMGRALFGSDVVSDNVESPKSNVTEAVYSIHGKDELRVWDELATSDNEDEESTLADDDTPPGFEFPARGKISMSRFTSAGSQFESQLIQEDLLMNDQKDTPITGLEREEDTRPAYTSPRARVRRRLDRACDFAGLVLESRFMEDSGIIVLLQALTRMLKVGKTTGDSLESEKTEDGDEEKEFVLSPASEALTEVLICEIATKNKDRIALLWKNVLHNHYSERLEHLVSAQDEKRGIALVEPGTEKCVTGLLRICSCALQKDDVANEVVASLSWLSNEKTPREIEELDKHISEGIWRICNNVDGLLVLDSNGWTGLLGLMQWCGARAAKSFSNESGKSVGLAEDDPGINIYRSLYLMLHAPELKSAMPVALTEPILALVRSTDIVGCSKLCLAGVDLLHKLQSLFEEQVCTSLTSNEVADEMQVAMWKEVLNCISNTARESLNSIVRSHAISILTDTFLSKQGNSLSPSIISDLLSEVCIEAASGRISDLLEDESDMVQRTEDIMIEFEQSVSLIFKPFVYHVKNIIVSGNSTDLEKVWSKLLSAMEELLQEKPDEKTSSDPSAPGALRKTLKDLASEHLRNAIMVLHAHGVLHGNPDDSDSLSVETWIVIDRMTFCTERAKEWQETTSSA